MNVYDTAVGCLLTQHIYFVIGLACFIALIRSLKRILEYRGTRVNLKEHQLVIDNRKENNFIKKPRKKQIHKDSQEDVGPQVEGSESEGMSSS